MLDWRILSKPKSGNDILVNNAAVVGSIVTPENFESALSGKRPEEINWSEIPTIPNYEVAEQCLNTSHYGTKRVIEALLPLLQLSDSPRIVDVSSGVGKLMNFPNGWAKEVLSDAERLTEEKIDCVLIRLLEDFKKGDTEIWFPMSKAALNAYTRILAKKYPNFCINCVSPGFVKTDITFNVGNLTINEGAETSSGWRYFPTAVLLASTLVRKKSLLFEYLIVYAQCNR